MFYSKDLLSRRSPLGAIWTIAHGKKLSKNKLLGISVQEICNEILHPDVPHSLRLQGILIGGVVVVFNKQTHYLLEDLQEMMRRVKDAIRVESGGAEQATLQHGKDKAKREAITLVDHDSGLAAEDAMLYNIDLNNLLVPSLANPAMVLFTQHRPARSMSLGGFQDAELFAVPTQSGYTKSGLTQSVGRQTGGQEVTGGRQALLGGHGGDGADYAEQDEVFGDVGEMMMGGLLDDEAMGLGMHMDLGMLGMADPTAQAKASSMVGSENAAEASSPDGAVENRLNNNNAAARKARGSDASMAVEEGAMEVEDGLGAAEDRMDLVGRKRKPSGAPTSEDSTGYRGSLRRSGDLAVVEEGEEQLEAGQADHGALSPASAAELANEAALLREEYQAHDSEHLATEEEGDRQDPAVRAVAAAAAAKRRVVKRKALQMVVDDLDDIQIKSKEFRDWTLDTSSLLAPRGLKRPTGVVSYLATLAASSPAFFLLHSTGLQPADGLGEGQAGHAGTKAGKQSVADMLLPKACTLLGSALMTGGVQTEAAAGEKVELMLPLCPPLAAVFDQALQRGVSELRTASAELEGEVQHQRNRKRTKFSPQNQAGGAAAALEQQGQQPAQSGQDHSGQHQLLEHPDEMHDMVHELPFGGDIEVERLRALSSPHGSTGLGSVGHRPSSELGSGAARLLGQSAGGLASLRAPGSRAASETSGHSSLGLGQQLVHRLGAQRTSSVSGPDSGGLLLPGSGHSPNDLLAVPDITGGSSHGRHVWTRSGAKGRGADSRSEGASEGALMHWGSAALEDLLPAGDAGFEFGGLDLRADSDGEELGAAAAMPARPSGPVATLDFQLLESSAGGFMTQQLRHQQQPLGASGMGKSTAVVLKLVRQELDMQSAAGQADPAVSFLSLAQRLTRAEAVKLFMQVLVTQTAGLTRAAQNRPFGDILIRQGGVMSS